MATWLLITDLGDSAVTVPLAGLMLFFLTVTRQLRLAFIWTFAVLGCASVIGGLKLLLEVGGNPILWGDGLVSPSGHTAMSAVVYGGFAAVIGAQLPSLTRALLTIGAATLIVAMPASRVALHLHSQVEVAVGLAIGLTALAIITSAVMVRRQRLPVLWLVGTAIILTMFFHGERWSTDRIIHHLAAGMGILRL